MMNFLGDHPIVKTADIWTTLPECFREQATQTPWAQANRGGEVIDSFLEGPVFDNTGNLYVTDIPYGRIFKITPHAQWELIVQYDGEPNGMKWLAEDVLVIADYRNGLMQLDLKTRAVSPVLQRRNSESFKGVNDLTFDSRGNLYFTDQGQTGLHDPTGRVYRLRPDGQLDLLLDNVPSPNGLVLSPNEQVLYVAATRGNEVWRAPFMADGSVSKVGRFFSSYGPSGPDGLAMDASGHLMVANPGLGCVWRLNERAEPTEVWQSPIGRALTNLAFAPGKTCAFATESASGAILRFETPYAGTPVHVGL
ncbi:MAG TPA: SMP-30/gluconolactonase/LRE family protein [Orrella sp.]